MKIANDLKQYLKTIIIDVIILLIFIFVLEYKLLVTYGVIVAYHIIYASFAPVMATLMTREIMRNVITKLIMTPLLISGALWLFFQYEFSFYNIFIVYKIILGYLFMKIILTVILNRLWH